MMYGKEDLLIIVPWVPFTFDQQEAKLSSVGSVPKFVPALLCV